MPAKEWGDAEFAALERLFTTLAGLKRGQKCCSRASLPTSRSAGHGKRRSHEWKLQSSRRSPGRLDSTPISAMTSCSGVKS